MNQRKTLVFVGATLGFVYVVLAFLVNARAMTDFDVRSIEWLQTVIPRACDLPFSILSLIGSFEITAVFVFLVLFFLFRPRFRVLLFVLFLAIVAVEGLGKELLVQPGPPDEFSRMVRLFSMPTASVYTPYSFPSGHAARSAFITLVVFAWLWQSKCHASVRWMLMFLFAAAELIMLVSRVYLGEHWSTDVFGGTVLGLICALPAVASHLDPPK